MAGTTTTGYHDPVGADPVQPASELTTDPTDVALLARSIENAHPRGYYAAGAASAGSALRPLGAVTNTVASYYSRTTQLSVTNSGGRITDDGWYRITACVKKTGTANTWRAALQMYLADEDVRTGAASDLALTLTTCIYVIAGNDVTISVSTTTDTANVERLVIERVGP